MMISFKFSQSAFCENPQVSTFSQARRTPRIVCGLRNGPRKPLWRKHVLSTEAIQAVQSLKLAQDCSKLEHVFNTKVCRLLKDDLLDTLAELQRQNELDLALQVFNFVRKEVWYAPDLSLFNQMIRILGKNKMIDMAERLFADLRNEGLEPDTRTFTEMIGAYFKVEQVNKAMDAYELMKASGCNPDKLTFTILIRNLEKAAEAKVNCSSVKIAQIFKVACSTWSFIHTTAQASYTYTIGSLIYITILLAASRPYRTRTRRELIQGL
ncbi:pentatricopeptide repeat-containing protein-like [Dorcoceras hygrometricum]|uniref:Pentatricopeptide repeat-containing protein-like n=1 Tax=Dorcoceras hygrometricum TaxID=472368 RepID=A0A2Z7ABT8_9LAMI|nr:pentatricopeptide repeat-containing protein-like [Dorcoceras hygrometricum]